MDSAASAITWASARISSGEYIVPQGLEGLLRTSSLLLGVIASATLGTSVVGPSWLFGKLALLAVILVLVLWLEKAFQPAVIGFMTLPETGSTPELEKQIKGAMDTTYTSVIGIYACTLGAAFLGLSKYAFG